MLYAYIIPVDQTAALIGPFGCITACKLHCEWYCRLYLSDVDADVRVFDAAKLGLCLN